MIMQDFGRSKIIRRILKHITFISLMNSLLAVDPLSRPTCDEILAHPWLNENCATETEA